MARWLAPRLAAPQRWVLHDLDRDLLAVAADRVAGVAAADGSPVTVETRHDDVTRLGPADLADADVVTCSALLDLLTSDELGRLVARCTAAGCPTLLTLTVVGRVELVPSDPLDAQVAAALFREAGAEVAVRDSPWRLDGSTSALAAEWCSGWVAAAQEQSPALAPALRPYVRRRLREARAGALRVTVAHGDLLAVPAPGPSGR